MDREAWRIFQKEFLEIARDRRAVLFAFILPLVLYPLLFISYGFVARPVARDASLTVGLAGDYTAFVPFLEGARLEWKDSEADPGAVRRGDLALLAEFRVPEAGSRTVRVDHASTSPRSKEALRRLEEALSRYADHLLERRFAERGLEIHPDRAVRVEARDLSTPRERSASRLGLILPLILLVLLLTGGSFAALDLVAGEKERGTLETLFLTPIPRSSIVRGKFLVVLAVSYASLAFNFAGFIACFALGLGPAAKDTAGAALVFPSLSAMALVAALTLPLAFLTSGMLLGVSAFARSFRESQTYLFPLTLVAIVLVGLALLPDVQLASVVSIVPVANIALAIRESLEGRLQGLPLAMALATSWLYAAVTLRWASGLLQREDLALGLERPQLLSDATAEGRSRRAIFAASIYLLGLYFAASWVQARGGLAGVAVTLWGMVLVPALLYPLVVGAPFRDTLGLKAAPAAAFLLAPVLAASLAILIAGYMMFQDELLPTPQGLEEAFEELLGGKDVSPLLATLVLAISPGICEELLWRGAFQGELEPRRRPLWTAVVVGVFFGIFHFSVFRFVPTALMGAGLAWVRHATGSVLPCMVVHSLYNAILIFGLGRLGEDRLRALLTAPYILLPAGVALAMGLWTLSKLGRRPAEDSADGRLKVE